MGRSGAVDGRRAVGASGSSGRDVAINESGAIGTVSGSTGFCPGFRPSDVSCESEAGKTTTRRSRKKWATRNDNGTGGDGETEDLASPDPGIYARIGVHARSGSSPGSPATNMFVEKENENDDIPMMSENVAVASVAGICADGREAEGKAEDDDAEVAFSVEKMEGMGRRRPLGPVRRSVELGQLPVSK